MTRKGRFDIRIKFEDEKIIDNKMNNIEEVDNIFKDMKKKFK